MGSSSSNLLAPDPDNSTDAIDTIKEAEPIGKATPAPDHSDVKKCIQAHGEEINCLAVSADASLLASGSEDCSVRLWTMEGFECVQELLGHNDYITCLVFAGKALLSGSGDMTVRKWDFPKGECLFIITGHMGSITSICVTRTQIFTSGNESLVYCWSLEDGTQIRQFEGHKGAVYGILITAGRRDFNTTLEETEPTAGRRRVRFVTFSADCTARLWSATRSTSLQTFAGHTGPVTCVALDQNHHYLYTGSSEGRIASWLIETGQRIHWFEGHTAPIIDLIVSGNYLYSASSDETARAWVTDMAQELRTFKPHDHTVFKLALKDDLLITGSGDGEIRCFETNTAIILERFTCPEEGKFCCFELVGNLIIAASQEGRICVCDLSPLLERIKTKE
ncbi:WD repeat-containing protein 86 [Echinococcus granulosus]|uniref:WD repeat-containing protein 86 n=1 Tax=Echinococcus granulosus TaxID=6210 RepID=W6V3P8_ECHGR|nr:WD repeat-containing protein 86 [Echinococcus granulosus]EUB60664.1 WD repeat-containing protein 86 [Echinococcus granulosus]KAH9282824.1 WD repeat-containing protein 86 [Echinococcus granulosus]